MIGKKLGVFSGSLPLSANSNLAGGGVAYEKTLDISALLALRQFLPWRNGNRGIGMMVSVLGVIGVKAAARVK
jgi:hypothetical protein